MSYHELFRISDSLPIIAIYAFTTFQEIVRLEFAVGHLRMVIYRFMTVFCWTFKFVRLFSICIAVVSF